MEILNSGSLIAATGITSALSVAYWWLAAHEPLAPGGCSTSPVEHQTMVGVISNVQPERVLMDLRMPNLDAIEATRNIRAEYPGMKVMILTTFEADNNVIQALKVGARGYLLTRSFPASWLGPPASA